MNRSFSIIDALHDPKCKFNYVSTVGGFIVNRYVQRSEEKGSYENITYSLFSFFMALFCQSFRNELSFNMNFEKNVENVDGVGRVSYEQRFDVCGDGHVRCTLAYETSMERRCEYMMPASKLLDVYRSPIRDIDVDIGK